MSRKVDNIHPDRISGLNEREGTQGRYVLYWMQRAQRATDNHALEYAVAWANSLSLPLIVCFGLTPGYPEANVRHYAFMIEGLADTAKRLAERGIAFVVAWGSPPEVAATLGAQAAGIVCDGAYLRHLRRWRGDVSRQMECKVVLIETDLVVPIRVASDHREYGARTIRKKVMGRLEEFAHLPTEQTVKRPSADDWRRLVANAAEGLRFVSPLTLEAIRPELRVDESVMPVSRWFVGGESEARSRFERFVAEGLATFDAERNHPSGSSTSGMSPYLHFGHISPVRLVVEAERVRPSVGSDNVDTFIEQLVVRRELAYNYCYYEHNYASYDALPEWARLTLEKHRSDERPTVYRETELEAAETHDDYWNAAMREMRITGSMHNYMRMYWGKKILEWSADPKSAFETTLRLNNKYFLDGRDANSYANVGWIFGLHDRPWPERPVYGTIRSMTASGLERKTDIASYVLTVRELAEGERRISE